MDKLIAFLFWLSPLGWPTYTKRDVYMLATAGLCVLIGAVGAVLQMVWLVALAGGCLLVWLIAWRPK